MGCNSYPYLAKWCNLNIIIGNLLCIEIWKALKNEKARQVIQFLYLHSRAEVWLHFLQFPHGWLCYEDLFFFFQAPSQKGTIFYIIYCGEIYSINKYFFAFPMNRLKAIQFQNWCESLTSIYFPPNSKLFLDRHQVWRYHDPTSAQTFDFCDS